MTCSYTSGFLSALVKEYGLTKPDIIIAGSGSAGTAACYVAGQSDNANSIWANRLSNKQFINIFRFWKIMNVDYLIDTVLKVQEPLNIEAIQTSETGLYIPVTNCQNGQLEFKSNRGEDDIFEILRATKALPFFYGKTVAIGLDRYFDSPLSSRIETCIPKAIELGATDIIAIASNNPRTMAKIIYQIWVHTRSRAYIKNYKGLLKQANDSTYPNDVNIVIIRPKNKLKIRALDNNKKILKKTIEQGYNDCKNDPRIAEVLAKY